LNSLGVEPTSTLFSKWQALHTPYLMGTREVIDKFCFFFVFCYASFDNNKLVSRK